MGSKVSKAKRPTPTKTEVVIIPRIPQDAVLIPPWDTVPIPLQGTIPIIPQDTLPIIPRATIPTIPHDIINEILDHLASDSDLQSLRACTLVSKSWVQLCQRHLFHTALFTPANAYKWLKTFPSQEESPARHVRDLCLQIGEPARIPEKFFECIPWFTDVDRMSLLGYGGAPLGYGRFSPLWEPLFWKLPRSVTSLTIRTGAVTLLQVRDIMAQLPNLDDLVISGLGEMDRRTLPGIGTALKGRFCGRLMLRDACVVEDVINMLLEIPSGLRFAELEIHCTRSCLPSSAIRLAEACGKTLVKLLHRVSLQRKSNPVPSPIGSSARSMLTPFSDTDRRDTFERSFNFSKFPNVQEVIFSFRPGWRGEGMPWIPMALSTLRSTTSPRLSVIKLDFTPSIGVPVENMIAGMGNDLRRIADEVARIEREFAGAVNFTVLRDSGFGAVLDTLNVRLCFIGRERPRGDVDFFVPCRSFSTTLIEMGHITPTCVSSVTVLVFPPRLMDVWCGGLHPSLCVAQREARSPVQPHQKEPRSTDACERLVALRRRLLN